MEKRKFLILPGLELPPLCRPARSQSLYRLSYRGSCFVVFVLTKTASTTENFRYFVSCVTCADTARYSREISATNLPLFLLILLSRCQMLLNISFEAHMYLYQFSMCIPQFQNNRVRSLSGPRKVRQPQLSHEFVPLCFSCITASQVLNRCTFTHRANLCCI
jgi:hypothetical protein